MQREEKGERNKRREEYLKANKGVAGGEEGQEGKWPKGRRKWNQRLNTGIMVVDDADGNSWEPVALNASWHYPLYNVPVYNLKLKNGTKYK